MATSIQRPYKVRTSWEDSKSQYGSYAYVDTAIEAAQKIYGYEEVEVPYKVFKDGVCIYNPEEDEDMNKPLFENTKGAIATSGYVATEEDINKNLESVTITTAGEGEWLASTDSEWVASTNSESITDEAPKPEKQSLLKKIFKIFRRN